jgi:predicted molibdopterin-dependent oxidoreductase YjgC
LTEKVKVRIDGEVIAATTGQTILEVARANDKYIPALCYMEGLSAVGACRLCMVEVQGVARLLPACTTPVQEGLAVDTTSPQLQSYRKIALELLLRGAQSHLRRVRLLGHCELQALAQEHGVTYVRYPYNFPRSRSTPRTRASCWTTTAASSARAACVPAPRSRARTSGTSPAVASNPGSSPS